MAQRILDHAYSVQETGWWCGPGSTQIVLTCRGIEVPEPELARSLGTTVRGTDWIGQITAELTRRTGRVHLTREMPNDPPSREQRDRMWSDLRNSIDNGFGAVANIWAPPGNQPPGYPRWETIMHYIAVVGYDDDRGLYIADPARFGGIEHYWLTADKLASLIAPKGYAAVVDPPARAPEDDPLWGAVLTQLVGPRG